MFVDASTLVALLTDPAKAQLFATRLEAHANRMTSVPCVLDAVDRLATTTGADPVAVHALLERFLDAMGVRVVSVPANLSAAAAALLARFGRTSERPDGLSAGRCLVLATARYYRLTLLSDEPVPAGLDIAG